MDFSTVFGAELAPFFTLKINIKMSEWFQAKVKFAKQLGNGLIKQSTELYLIDAVSFTDAETRAFKEAGDNRDVQAVSIARSPIKEVVFYGDTDLWHKVKVTYSLMDEATEKEKKVTTYFLVNANDVKEAYERTEEHLKEMVVPFKIQKVEESPICEVFQYEKAAPKGFVKVDNNGVGSESPFVKQHGWGASPDDEHEEECAMEGDEVECVTVHASSAELLNMPKEPDISISADGSTITYTNPTTEYAINPKAGLIDPTDGQAVSFEADPLWTLLNDNGILCLDQDLHEIRSWKDSPFRDFHECMEAQFDAPETVSKIIWEYLKTENEAMKGGGND